MDRTALMPEMVGSFALTHSPRSRHSRASHIPAAANKLGLNLRSLCSTHEISIKNLATVLVWISYPSAFEIRRRKWSGLGYDRSKSSVESMYLSALRISSTP
jgi:hypothetical protein